MKITVLEDVEAEQRRQTEKWGAQRKHSPLEWLAILTEEVGEVAKEVADGRIAAFRVQEYRNELIQVAAVAVMAIESLDAKVMEGFLIRP
jgi:NTP pyrophosphatase (non-canonical NTP hydrolase)